MYSPFDILEFGPIVFVLFAPLVYALARARNATRDDFIFNSGRTGLLATIAGIVCGNIGAGTFVALLLFSDASPILGVSLACAYALGLVICGAIAPVVHRQSSQYGVHGLVDLIVAAHRVRHPLAVWIPIAFVFLLRTAVQLLALAAILATILPVSNLAALVLASAFTGIYTAIGGYRVATETDIFQAIVILVGIGVLTLTNAGGMPHIENMFDLGPYKLPLLVGVWLFIPVSAVLAIDNWQRMATARAPAVARRAFLLAAPLCLFCYLSIVWLGLKGHAGEEVLTVLRATMPAQWAWLADVMLIAVLMSTMDTFVMPLITSLERTRYTLRQLQLMVLMLFSVLAIAAYAMGPLLNSIIAAFSSLVVFLPAVLAALLTRNPRAGSAVLSLNLGVAVSLVLVGIDLNYAAFAGFGVAALTYGLGWGLASRSRRSGQPLRNSQ
ncbi:sodium:solute symporter family transporter [Nitratireductor rhodophyticola]